MPIKIPDNLPGRVILEAEGVPFILQDRALRQDIRPLQIAILNLMPDKIKTETQLLRALGATPLQIDITLLHPASHKSKNTPEEHLTAFYQTFDDVANRNFDGLIITGAAVEPFEYSDVTYWDEFARILEWSKTHVHSSFFICWSAQAALYHYHGLGRNMLSAKRSGVYPHKLLKPADPLMAGFDDVFDVPVSRNMEMPPEQIEKHPVLEILAESEQSGVCILHDRTDRRVYIFNHLEYDAETLKREYERDLATGAGTAMPENYFPDNDPSKPPKITWRAHRSLLFGNWLNSIYQSTPYDLSLIGK